MTQRQTFQVGDIALVCESHGVIINRDVNPQTTEEIGVIPWATVEALLRTKEEQS